MNMKTIIGWVLGTLLLLAVLASLAVGLLPYVAIPPALAYFPWLYYRWHRLKSCGIIQQDSRLIQIDSAGRKTAEIDLSRPYLVDVSFKSFLKAIYTIRQGNAKVQFTSDADNARHIAVDVLGASKEWPPVGPWNFGW
jgi:hypothetical protein